MSVVQHALTSARPVAAAEERTLAFQRLYQDHLGFAWRCLRRMGVREADVEDACQEVFVVAHRKLRTLSPDASPRAWVFAICLRVAARFRRRACERRELPTADPPDAGHAAPQPADLERAEARAVLDAVLDTLDDDRRAVFVLFELEGVPMTEVATLVDCPLQTAYSRLHAARRHVDEAIRRHAARRRP